MSRRLGLRRPRVAGHMPAGPLVKASSPTSLPGGLALPSGSSLTDATSMLGALQGRTAGAVNGAVPLDRAHDFFALFGPGAPLFPSPLNSVNPATHQQDPRQTEYPVSYNILSNDRPVPWSTLRAAADRVDIIRLCLRTRKDELTEMDWTFGFTADAKVQLGISSPNAERHMRIEYDPIIKKLKQFWSIPDRTNDLSWPEWFGMMLEERFVLDATTIYPRMTYGGDLASLEIIDGSTIKPLIDEYGNRPMPPAPAYQQWLYGFPRGEYTDNGASDTWEGTAGSLVYKPYTRRTQSPYGFPEVEQALVSAEVYLRRQDWMRQEYTSGTTPTSFLKTDAQMTPDQYRAWNVVLNDMLSGSTSDRYRTTALPAGFDPVLNPDVAERYKADYDEFLVKLLCAHMATQPSEIGFTPSNGLGGAGFSDGQEDVTYRKSLRPTTRWVTGIGNQVSTQYLTMPPELTMQFLGMESEDEDTADDVSQKRVASGRMTLNEDRDRQGLPRYTFVEADMPQLQTARGIVFLDGASKLAAPGVEIGPAQAPPTGATSPVPPDGDAAPPADDQQDNDADNAADDSASDKAPPQVDELADADKVDAFKRGQNETKAPRGKPSEPSRPSAPQPAAPPYPADPKKSEELAAFGRFLAKRGKLTRPFAFTALDKADADELNALAATQPDAARERATELAKASDAGGRDRAPAGARRGDEGSYAGYPLHAPGAGP
jgi:hypothetical protein